MDLRALRVGLATRLATIANMNAYDYEPSIVAVPAAIITIGVITVHDDLSGHCVVPFTVHVLVQLSDWQSAQDTLDGYCSLGSALSVSDALESGDLTVEVDTIAPPGTVTVGDATYASASFHGRILA